MTTLTPKTIFRLTSGINQAVNASPAPLAPETLAQAIQQAVDAVDSCSLVAVFPGDAKEAFSPKTLLALLSLCYARQCYGSQQIEDTLNRDPSVREVCQNRVPNAWVLRYFRKYNRAAIRDCLLAGLGFLAEQKLRKGFVTKVNKEWLQAEANRRLAMAAFIDTTETACN